MERSNTMLAEIKGLNEECGIFGIWGHKEASLMTYYGLHSLQHRGQEGAGIVAKNGEGLKIYKSQGIVAEAFTKDILDDLSGNAAIGHVRYPTTGKTSDMVNIQPFLFHFEEASSVALCHNGNLTNTKSIRRELEGQGSIFQTSSDSEILVHLIKRNQLPTFADSVKQALSQVRGGFAYILLTQNQMIAARDPNGFKPLSIGELKDGGYCIASETCAFDIVGAKFLRNVAPGEMIIIDDTGLKSQLYTKDTSLAICSMEYVYFARPDSDIEGTNVHTARKSMGKALAKAAPAFGDVVIGVPDSGISAAIGFSEESKIPYEIGLIKNRYIARTFIKPTQELREQGVKMKLSAVRGVVEGKRVVLIDDSIVRGTTSRRIVTLLRDAGASEVHVRVSSPLLKYPCFFGMNIQSTKELIANKKSAEEICELIGADSLEFMSVKSLTDTINLPYEGVHKGLCVACFNKCYCTSLFDYTSAIE